MDGCHCPSSGSSCGRCAHKRLPYGLVLPLRALPTPVGVAPVGIAYARTIPTGASPQAAMPVGSILGRGRLCLLATALAGDPGRMQPTLKDP
ncbi:hypothetical protein BHM03_00060087 [Ensete ventricosum]|nr:hypothetical protein BHM03_00060087 [Ensete ventricosum]